MNKQNIRLEPLKAVDREQFIRDNQEAFLYGATQEFGMRDDHFEEDGEIISREPIERAIDDGEAYRIVQDGENVAAISLYALGVKPEGWSFSARVPGNLFTDVKGQIRPYHGDWIDLLCGGFMWIYTNLGHPLDKFF